MRDYLKCSLTEDEKNLVNAIIWMTARDYKKRLYRKSKYQLISIDDVEVSTEDEYSFVKIETREEFDHFYVLTETDKERIVEYVNCVLLELSLYKFGIALTFDEKLVLFLCSFKKYSEKHTASLLQVKLRRIKYLKESLKIKKEKFLGGYKNV